ncbi:MAG: YolD-like family protein [Lachnospiraceae bacterium]|nr:YolD-like family protein [Lachnospiraceae bacterium]
MVYMPHHVSLRHPHMSRRNRAAQFAPFAAVTGHEESIGEVARYVEEKIELDDNQKELVDNKIRAVFNSAGEKRKVSIIYFKRDKRKKGGGYFIVRGFIEKFDEWTREVVMVRNVRIPVEDIYDISQI